MSNRPTIFSLTSGDSNQNRGLSPLCPSPTHFYHCEVGSGGVEEEKFEFCLFDRRVPISVEACASLPVEVEYGAGGLWVITHNKMLLKH